MKFLLILLYALFYLQCCNPVRRYNTLQMIAKNIRIYLKSPAMFTRHRLTYNIQQYNQQVQKLICDIANHTKEGIRDGRYLYRKGRPHFLAKIIDANILREKFMWTTESITRLMALFENSNKIFDQFLQTYENITKPLSG